MAKETDLAKEFESLRKRCLELENEKEDLKKRNQELEGKIAAVQKVVIGDDYLHEVMIESKVETEVRFWKEKVKELEEKIAELRLHSMNTTSAKRKRATEVITSDEDDGYDDNAPISTLKPQRTSRVITDTDEEPKENLGRRYLTRLRKSEFKHEQEKSSFDLNKNFSSSEDEEYNDGVDGSESEGGSLDGFIDDRSENVSNCDESEDMLNEYKATLDKIGRKRISNLKWDLEGDMLSDFGKDPELCMSAVCALYRQQTADEQASKVTIYQNERGFSQPDASRGSKLSQFLTDGDPNGDLNKTAEELKEYDSEGLKLCRALAAKYSKQLFEIYQNKEDPLWPPRRYKCLLAAGSCQDM